MPEVTLRSADGALSYVESLLASEGLPTADVRSKPDCFHVAFDDDRVGIGGLERRGTDALVRSVVVEPSERGRGYGSAICAALEREAREAGVESLYLLTTTAEPFFADRGYERIDRSEAPERIRETREFAELCPDAAACMTRSP